MHRGNRFLKSPRIGLTGWVKATALGVFLIAGAAASSAASESLKLSENLNGKDLHELKCAKCHRLYDPKDYDPESWETWKAKMKKKARLNEEESRLIFGYLDSLKESKET